MHTWIEPFGRTHFDICSLYSPSSSYYRACLICASNVVPVKLRSGRQFKIKGLSCILIDHYLFWCFLIRLSTKVSTNHFNFCKDNILPNILRANLPGMVVPLTHSHFINNLDGGIQCTLSSSLMIQNWGEGWEVRSGQAEVPNKS